ncbi:MAG: (d)CMP kinase [Actinomycetota bacterium]|nr:MAG: (d)CMP kinase [Actinomycetota bacterium]
MNNKENIITIDGPAGSGKSTIAKILAKELNFRYIDTGAMYRTMTLIALRNKVDLEDEDTILEIAKKAKLEIDSKVPDENEYTSVKLNGEDITKEIRSSEVGAAVSIVSKLSGIRKYLVSLQRALASNGNSILEGRDTGSIVCPDAILKIFLTASISERIKRRRLQLEGKNQAMEASSIEKEIRNRDMIDSTREDSPLIIPENGIEIDTSGLSIEEVVNKIKELYYVRTKT